MHDHATPDRLRWLANEARNEQRLIDYRIKRWLHGLDELRVHHNVINMADHMIARARK